MTKSDSDRLALMMLNDSEHSYKLNQLVKETEDPRMKIFFAIQTNELKKIYERARCFGYVQSKTEWDGDPKILKEVLATLETIDSNLKPKGE